jgi:endonuclease YncB( thermonuclease family)
MNRERTVLIVLLSAILGSLPWLASGGPLKMAPPADSMARAAAIVRIIDGDTMVLNINLGDGVGVTNRHVRLTDVHSFERFTEEGIKETEALKKKIADNPGNPVVIVLQGEDKYGRLLGTVWLGPINLNDYMKTLPQGGK